MKPLRKVFYGVFAVGLLLTSLFSAEAQTDEPTAEPESEYVLPLDAARAAGLGAEVNQTQTIGGVSVTLDYVYADVREINIFATVESTRGQVDISHQWTPRLDGARSRDFVRYGEGSRLAEDVALTPIIKSFTFGAPYSAEPRETLTDEFDLTFVMSTLTDPVRAPEATVDASPDSTKEAAALPDFTFEFHFTVPFYGAVEKQLDMTQTVSSIPLSLKSVSVTPISAELELCAEFPHDSTWKLQEIMLGLDGERNEVYLHNYFFRSEACKSFSFSIYAGAEPKWLEFQIGAFGEDLTWSPAVIGIDWEALLPTLEDNGVKITLDGAGFPEIIDTIPPGTESNYVDVLNELGVGERIEGPWVFEVDLQ